MSRVVTRSDDLSSVLEVCDRCGYFLDGVANCPYCGEPNCPECGCLCGSPYMDYDEDGYIRDSWGNIVGP